MTTAKLRPTPTPAADQARIDAVVDKLANLLDQLYARWQDEREYEDIADYGLAIAKQLPSGFTLLKATKRPFGFRFSLDTMPGAIYAIEVTMTQMRWKRVY